MRASGSGGSRGGVGGSGSSDGEVLTPWDCTSGTVLPFTGYCTLAVARKALPVTGQLSKTNKLTEKETMP